MLDVTPQKKSKICLTGYDLQGDLKGRLMMAKFSQIDLDVLEEILYSPVQTPLRELLRPFAHHTERALESLRMFEGIGLLAIRGTEVVVDKERRKYYEAESAKFSEEFKPGLEFVQGLLKKVPIHQLLAWYSIPRSADQIFESLIEQYLKTPAIYEKNLAELANLEGPGYQIVQELMASPELKLMGSEVRAHYGLSPEEFEETMLLLEFQFAAYLTYERIGEQWQEVVVPLEEWKEYLLFLKKTKPQPLPYQHVEAQEFVPFAFLEELSSCLWSVCENRALTAEAAPLLARLESLRLIRRSDASSGWTPTEMTPAWLRMELEEQALQIHRSLSHHPDLAKLSPSVQSERMVREAEKAILRAPLDAWVQISDLIDGALVALQEASSIKLIRQGKQWRYRTPVYTDAERQLLFWMFSQALYEMGAVEQGLFEGQPCLRLTPFGRNLFSC